MLFALLNPANQGTYNIIVAQKLGLDTAVYINVLIELWGKYDFKKSTPKKDQYFNLDRDYIKSKTSLLITRQREIDASLMKMKIITVDENDNDRIYFDVFLFAGMFGGDVDEPIINKIIKLGTSKSKEQKQETKRKKLDYFKFQCHNTIDCDAELSPIIRTALKNWVDIVVDKNGFISDELIRENIKILKPILKRDEQTAFNIINYTAQSGWAKFEYAINKFKTGELTFSRTLEMLKNEREQIQKELEDGVRF